MTKESGGFSLIEMSVVIIILAILTVGAITYSSNTISVRAFGNQLLGDIHFIQQKAMASNTRYRVNFSSGQYTFTDLAGTTAVIYPGGAGNSNTVTLPTGMTLSTSGLPNGYLVFNSLGVPYTNNAIPGTALASAATLTLSYQGNSATVTIQPSTGSTSLS